MKDRSDFDVDTQDRVDTQERSVRGTIGDTDTETESFLPEDRMDDLRDQWSEIQAGFVDDPRTAVKQAHDLVTEIVNELTETFSRERGTLESQWNRGENADTENLRVALQRYRAFFDRLLR